MDALRPFLSRLLSPVISALAGYLLVHYGINFDKETQAQINEQLITWIIPLVLAIYGLVHRLFDKRFNPGDAASSHLAKQESAEATDIKRASSN